MNPLLFAAVALGGDLERAKMFDGAVDGEDGLKGLFFGLRQVPHSPAGNDPAGDHRKR